MFLSQKHFNRFFHTLNKVPPLIVTGAVVAVLFVPLQFAVQATFAIVVLTAVLITCLHTGTAAYNLFTHPRVVYIGLISYSLYLWHWGVLSLSRWTIGIHLWLMPLQIALMLLLSIVSYRYVETPLRRSDWSGVRWKSIGYGIGASTIAAIGLIIFYELIASRIYLGNILKVETPENLREAWWRNQKGEYIEKCHIENEYKESLLTECFQRKQVNQQTFFLIGDSHARNYLKAIQTAFPSVKTVYLTMGSGCSFLPSSLISPALEEGTQCLEYTQDVATYLFQEAKEGDVVFVGQFLISSPERYTSRYTNFIGEFADALRSKEVPVILLDGTAPPPRNPEFCWSTPWRPSLLSGCTTSISEVRERYSKFDSLAESLSNQDTNVFYVSLRDGLCIQDICGQMTAHGTPIWHDRGHITEQSSAELAPLLIERLQENRFSQKLPGIIKITFHGLE